MIHFYASPLLSFTFSLFSFVALLCALRLSSSSGVPLRLSLPLLQEHSLARRQRGRLSVVDALQPISEARAAEGVDGVCPEGRLVEEWAHFDADLPEAGGEAYRRRKKKR